MSATVLTIVEKVKPFEVVPAQLENFVVSEGESIPAQTILDNPNLSLYCLDDPNQRTIFVETPPDVDLVQAPFYYDAQYKHAQRLIALPYAEFHALASQTKTANLIFVYSVGRCGSTVISQALNTVDGVVSLSEPDVYTQIHLLRHADKSRDADYKQRLESCTRLLSKNISVLAIKFRGMCIHIGDLLYEVFPQGKNLFLYRHAESWARSMGLEMVPPEERRTPATEVPLHRRSIAPLSIAFAVRHGREPTRNQMTALMWLSMIDLYLKLYDQAMPFLTIRYENIQAYPRRVLAAVFDYCDFDADVKTAYEIFSKDSQEGSVLSRARRQSKMVALLEVEDYAHIHATLKEHPVIQSSDFIALGTYDFGAI